MTPPCVTFDVSELPRHVQADLKGKKRKLEGGADVDLSKCVLRAMTQFRCIVQNPEVRDSPVGCWPIQRFFRQCQDKKGTFTVETTAWEGLNTKTVHRANINGSPDGGDGKLGASKTTDKNGNRENHHQWSQAWEEQ
ncbi:uncharacterized protein CTRU02_215056 [Colletotrichum truncatum]|uniref:Uncharacterized protein n=1 Tax=Colletotrichum truncatum TaxID=5467 RepID=A0ACC3YEE5_COLTU|nr:uncharacterized protein CTRU02_08193 [Colletotrichum truncatum]KAF6790064.1 hypothetical protein CTRU02_08193 [Colletotrichum truncatum]